MNRSNVPYIVAAALLVLALGGWGIFLTSDHGEPSAEAEPDAGADVAIADAGAGPGDLADPVDAGGSAAPSEPFADATVTPEPPPVVPVPSMIPDIGFPLIAPPAADAAPDAGPESTRPESTRPESTRPESAGETETTDDSAPRKTISPDAIKTVISAMKPTMKVCYETLLDEFPDASGRVLVTFRVEARDEQGMVSIIEVGEETTLMDDKLLDCLTDAFADAEFPVPSGGEAVQVTYPFTFTTK